MCVTVLFIDNKLQVSYFFCKYDLANKVKYHKNGKNEFMFQDKKNEIK